MAHFRKTGRKNLIFLSHLLLFFISTACFASTGDRIVTDVTVLTEVTPIGQFPVEFTITAVDAAVFDGVSAEDFELKGAARGWMQNSLHEVTGTFSDVSVKDNRMTLTVDTFSEKYFYVEDFEVTCKDRPVLTFSKSDVSLVTTPVADDFENIRTEDGMPFEYNLFTPEKADEPLPVVIAFHGYGNTMNLLENKVAVGWALPENQAVRPAWVIAPVIENYGGAPARDAVYKCVHELVTEMIQDGKVDPDRIYLTGHSFGGMATLEYAEAYPEDPAGILAMCSACSYSNRAYRNLETIRDIPIRLAHAVTDQTISVSDSETVLGILENAGAKDVSLREYSDGEMIAAGGDPDTNSPASFHHVEMAVMEDPEYMVWLFEQVRS